MGFEKHGIQKIISFLLISSCPVSAQIPEKEDDAKEEAGEVILAVDCAYEYATGTGIELEKAYQEKIASQRFSGDHIITVGHDGTGTEMFIGNLEGAVQTLAKALGNNVKILRYGVNFTGKKTFLEALENYDGKITTIHSFGHGIDNTYWLTPSVSEQSLTVSDLMMISEEEKKIIRDKFTPDAYWKFYSCHAAADTGSAMGENLTKAIPLVFGITGVGANAWIFIKGEKGRTYMYPPSRERHRLEFEVIKPYLGFSSPDPEYTQHEAAWVTCSLNRE